MNEVKNILESLELTANVKELDDQIHFYVYNLLGLKIGVFILKNESRLNFRTYDPEMEDFTIEGGECSLSKESIEEIIQDFSYFPIKISNHIEEYENYQFLNLEVLLKKSYSNYSSFFNILKREFENSDNIFYYEGNSENIKDNAIEKLKESKPNASIVVFSEID